MKPRRRRWGAALLAGFLAVASAVALLSAPGASAAVVDRSPAIVGGGPLAITASPWDVALVQRGTLCSGSLISVGWIITAAHCVDGLNPSEIAAFAGVSTLSQRTAANQVGIGSIVLHPQWDPASYANDVALLQLTAPVTPSASVQPIALPDLADPLAWPAKGTLAAISGWGDTNGTGKAADQLQGATIQVLAGPADTQCGKYGSSFSPMRSICAGMPAGGVDTCQGDSGSGLSIPLAGTVTLAGVTSAGEGCAQAEYPGIYTRLTTYLPWIRQYVPAPVQPAPAALAVQPISQARAVVTWTPLAAPPAGGYTVTLAPGGATCTSATGPACVVTGLEPGRSYIATLTTGGAILSSSASFTAVSGAARVGTRIPARQVATWAGLTGGGTVRMSVPRASSGTCAVVSGRLVVKAPGTCVVKVTVGRRSARAYVAVTA